MKEITFIYELVETLYELGYSEREVREVILPMKHKTKLSDDDTDKVNTYINKLYPDIVR